MSEKGEFEFIRNKLASLSVDAPGALGLTDDAALLTPQPGQEIVLCSDMLVSGTHFLETDTMDVVAQRAFLSNLSDLAAMGADPIGYLCSVCWPSNTTDEQRDQFVSALESAQTQFGLTLLGGDTTSGEGPLVVSMTFVGEVQSGSALKRSGAKSGDDIWVTGSIGDAVLGLAIARGDLDQQPYLLSRYQNPTPRIEAGICLRKLASACIDISDGLVADAGHIASTSQVQLIVEAAMIPLSAPALLWLEKEGEAGLRKLLTAGDDYELLFTAPHDKASEILSLKSECGVDISWIGSVAKGQGVTVRDEEGEEMKIDSSGFTHF